MMFRIFSKRFKRVRVLLSLSLVVYGITIMRFYQPTQGLLYGHTVENYSTKIETFRNIQNRSKIVLKELKFNLTKGSVNSRALSSLIKNEDTNLTNNVLNEKVNDNNEYVLHLLKSGKSFCDGQFVGYGSGIAKLSNVVIDPKYSKRPNEDKIKSDTLPREEDEYFQLDNGFFNLKCSGSLKYSFTGSSYLSTWMEAVNVRKDFSTPIKRVSTWTIALTRIEYAHIYFSLLDIYNAYTVMKMFGLDPDKTDILLMDAHPNGMLDETWQTIFGEVTRLADIKDPVQYNNLVWNEYGHECIIDKPAKRFKPDFEGFRYFTFNRHGITSETSLNCNKLRILFIWRHDYVAHPRNPTGHVQRKFANEDELINVSRNAFPGHHIEGIQLDSLGFKDQLKLIANTDILFGMHGAGLAHAMFLPKHAALIELYPQYKSLSSSHFKDMCLWRGLHYSTWQNRDRSLELPGHRTLIKLNKAKEMLSEAREYMCPTKG